MIALTKNEEIERFQLEFSLLRKTNQSPFIAILLLAQEQDEVDAFSVAANLLPPLPERACNNLLKRLAAMGYFFEEPNGSISSYRLTERGKTCAAEKSFWVPEKGVYNVFVLKSNLIKQRIVKIERVVKSENDQHVEAITQLPAEILAAENEVLLLDDGEAKITKFEKTGFRLDPVTCVLQLQANASETTLSIQDKAESLFTTSLQLEEAWLREEILKGDNRYHEEKKAMLVEFDKGNLSFTRNVTIENPVVKNCKFISVSLNSIPHLPANLINAGLWYNELLYKSIDDYFFDDTSFTGLADEISKPFTKHYKLKIPDRNTFAKQLAQRNDAFYQLAKLETFNFLNY